MCVFLYVSVCVCVCVCVSVSVCVCLYASVCMHVCLDWENGTRVACKNGAIEREMCINFAQLYLRDG